MAYNPVNPNGQATSANSSPVVIASDQSTLPVSISGNQAINVTEVNNNIIATAAPGAQLVGIEGHGGATLDATVGAGSAPTNMLAVGGVYNSTAPAPTSGQSAAIQLDQAGNQRVFNGITLTTLSVWNSGTSVNTTQTIYNNSGASAVLIQLNQSAGTFTGGAITFQVSYDGSSFVTPPANTILDPTSASYAQIGIPFSLSTNNNKPFIIDSNGWQALQIKLSTAITGTGTVTPFYALLNFDPVDSAIVYSPTAANFLVQPSGGDLTSASQKSQIVDGSGNVIGSTSNALKVYINGENGDLATNIAQVGGSALALGNTTQSASVPVTLASNDATTNAIAASGATYPTNILAIGAKNTGNITALTSDSGNRLQVNVATAIAAGTNGIGTVGTTSGAVNVGQTTSGTSAVQLSSTSTVPTNGIIVEALVGNTAVVYIGGSGVTTSTGFQLSPGQSMSFSANLNTLYVVGSNTSDKVCWNVV